jgi:hypothetical protein
MTGGMRLSWLTVQGDWPGDVNDRALMPRSNGLEGAIPALTVGRRFPLGRSSPRPYPYARIFGPTIRDSSDNPTRHPPYERRGASGDCRRGTWAFRPLRASTPRTTVTGPSALRR